MEDYEKKLRNHRIFKNYLYNPQEIATGQLIVCDTAKFFNVICRKENLDIFLLRDCKFDLHT